MGYKIICIDVEEPCKIPIYLGINILGRGSIQNCDDRHISKSHCQVTLSDEDVVGLTAIHTNPTFFIKKYTDQVCILNNGEEVMLANGDRFGLLKDKFWFELIYFTEDSPPPAGKQPSVPTCTVTSQTCHNDELDDIKDETQSTVIGENEVETGDPTANEAIDEANPIENANQSTESEVPVLHYSPERDEEHHSTEVVIKCEETNDQSSPEKRAHVDAGDEEQGPVEKRVKKENNTEEDAIAGPSDDGPSCSGREAQQPPPPQIVVAPSDRPRERCMYGENCYRRNPVHLAQYAHPADADWGRESRPLCEWGARCRRRDPRHRQRYAHPPTQPRRPQMPRIVQGTGNTIYINANSIHFHNDGIRVEDSDEESVDYDYEF